MLQNLLMMSYHRCLRKRAAPVCIHWLGLLLQGTLMCVTTFTLSEPQYRGNQMLSSEAAWSAEEFYE